MLISNSLLISFANLATRELDEPPKTISSMYTCAVRISLPCLSRNNVWATFLLIHFIYAFYSSHSLEKGLKYNLITLLVFILTISMSFGEFMNLHGLLRKYAKKPL
jgi:hypothetical protein